MTNYRRLMSYIYAYRGEVKGKNTGFARLGSRNGQCRPNVNVKKAYVGSSDLGIYLLAPGKEVFLGSIFICSGGDKFRVVVNVENATDSGCSMNQYYGLMIREQGDIWRAYTTIWGDAVAHAVEMELVDVTSSKVGGAEAQIRRKVEELSQELRSGKKAAKGGDGPVPSSSPAKAHQISVGRGAMKNVEAPEGAEVVQETEVLAQTSEEVYQMESKANQMTEASDQAAEKVVGTEEILPEPTEADTVEMSQRQESQDNRDDLMPEPELLPNDRDSIYFLHTSPSP